MYSILWHGSETPVRTYERKSWYTNPRGYAKRKKGRPVHHRGKVCERRKEWLKVERALMTKRPKMDRSAGLLVRLREEARAPSDSWETFVESDAFRISMIKISPKISHHLFDNFIEVLEKFQNINFSQREIIWKEMNHLDSDPERRLGPDESNWLPSLSAALNICETNISSAVTHRLRAEAKVL